MHLLHHHDKIHIGKEDEKHGPDEICPHCGRKLMERRGVLRRLKPISNAFVLNGHCLACHSEEKQSDKDDETEKEKCEDKDEHEHEVSDSGSEEDEYTKAYYSLFIHLENQLHPRILSSSQG